MELLKLALVLKDDGTSEINKDKSDDRFQLNSNTSILTRSQFSGFNCNQLSVLFNLLSRVTSRFWCLRVLYEPKVILKCDGTIAPFSGCLITHDQIRDSLPEH